MKSPAYFELLRTIGIPSILEGNKVSENAELRKLAELNKIAILYSRSLNNDSLFQKLLPKYELLLNTIEEVTSIFRNNETRYSIFKTIKPFPTTPSDIDILLYPADFEKAKALLLSSGYKRVANDAYTSTLTKEMNVDLQLQPSVSNLPYLSRKFLMQNTVLKNINGFDVNAPTLEAEIIVIASHSIYKEQMFTLNDYYTITILAEHADPGRLLNLAKEAKVLEALRVIIALCSQITESVFDTRLKISELRQTLGASPSSAFVPNMPMKFQFSLVIKLLAIRASKDGEMRRMVVPAMARLASPTQLRKLVSHITRRTY